MLQRIVATYRAAFADLPRDVWLLCGITLVNRMGTMVLPFISLWLTRERGLAATAAGLVLGVYGVGSLAGAWIGGWLSDRIGPTRTQQISLVAGGAGLLVLGRAREMATIVVATFVVSVLAEGFRPAVMSDLARRAPRPLRLRAYALLRLAVNLGMGIGPAVGGWLALRDYGWLFLGDAVTCWLAAGLLWAMRDVPQPAAGSAAETRGGAARSPWSDWPFLSLMLLVALFATVFFQILGTVPLYYRDAYGLREDAIGVLLGLNAALIVAFEMALVQSVARRERLNLVGAGAFLVCIGFAAMPFGRGMLYLSVTILVWTVGEMLALPLLNAVVADRADDASRGRYMGLYMMAFSLAFVLAPLAGTQIYARSGGDALWYAVGLLGLPLWLWAASLRRAFGDSNHNS